MNNEEKVANILDTLSYSLASPAADQFMRYIGEKKFDKAKSMIKTYLDVDDVTFIINHFRQQVEQKFNLVPITIDDFNIRYPFAFDLDTPDVNIVVNYSGEIFSTSITRLRSDNEWLVYINKDFIPLSKLSQIWMID